MSLNASIQVQSLPGADDVTRVELSNGITLLTRRNPASPSVVLSGYLPAGSVFDPREKLGLAHFSALMLMRGTRQRGFQEIFDALESAGASLGFGASVHNVSFGGRALAEDLPLLLELAAGALREPLFPVEHVERLRTQLLSGLAVREQDTADQASLAFEEIIFPGHPYGLPADGYAETIRAIQTGDLADFHGRSYGPQGMVLVVVGAPEAAEVIEQVERALGEWRNPQQAAAPDFAPAAPLKEGVRRHIALPGKVQTDLVMGTLGPRRASPDFMAASLGNNILGQFGMMGRIGDAVREREGLAYYASTGLNGWINAGTWEVSAGVSPANLERAIELIRQEVLRFTAEPVSAEELSDSQANYVGRLPLSLESNAGVAHALLNLERFQLGLDYYRQYPAMVARITPEQVLEAARRYLAPDTFAVVSAGPAI